ncbi:MAG TPA: zf-HC2 domain-containing protein [Methylomirabilota bacterium]|jgi:hypothetical protein
MTCADAREHLTDLLDEVLDPSARAALEAHLATCAECRAELEGLRQTVTLLHRLDAPRAPASFVDRVMAAARPADRVEARRRRRFLFRFPVDLPAGVAAFLLVAVGVGFLLARTPELRVAARLDAPTRAVPLEERYAPPPASERAVAAPAAGETERERAAAERDASSRALADRAPAAAPPARPGVAQAPAPPPKDATPGAPAEATAPAPPEAPAPPDQPAQKSKGEEVQTALKGSRDEARALAKTGVARSAEAPVRAARMQPGGSSDIAARLSVADRATASTAVANLVSRAGGAVVSSTADGDERVLELIVPRAELSRLLEGLRALGALTGEVPPDLAPNVHLVLRIGA